MIKKHYLIFVTALQFARSALAGECSQIKTYHEILSCVLLNHPSVQRAQAEGVRAERLEAKAAQSPNLEFMGTAVRNLNDSSQTNGEMALSYTFELGGKRSARTQKAKFEEEFAHVDFEATRNETLLNALMDLQRIKYLRVESDLVEDGISIFEKIIKTYRSRLRLTPEQDVSVGVFSLALEDSKIRQAEISTEIDVIMKRLELQTGGKIQLSDSLLPPNVSTWPNLDEGKPSEGSSTYLRLIKKSLDIVQAEKEVALAEGWPDLKLGPDYQWSQGSGGIDKNLGLTLTLPLPFWNRNQGGIAVAQASEEKARVSLRVAEKENAAEKASWLVKYNKGVEAIQGGVSSEEMRKRHQKLRKQFTAGLVSSSLVIEANRQIFEFTKSKNRQELSVLEALWNLKRLNGSLGEVVR